MENSSMCSLWLTGHPNLVANVVFSPNGKYLASGSYDRTILKYYSIYLYIKITGLYYSLTINKKFKGTILLF